ncbi:F0F1 ATP synthase subunit B [bacterium]|nr:F0F1 ATP synthase subunit B [bacterium]
MGEILKLINFPLLISSAIGFIVLWLVLKKTLFGAVLNVVDERRDSIEQAFREVDEARQDVARMKADYEAHLAQIQAEAQSKLQESLDRGKQMAEQIRIEAEQQREKLLAKTQEDIQREKEKAVAELREAAVSLSFDISNRVLKDGLDRGQHDKLVAGFIDDLKRLN